MNCLTVWKWLFAVYVHSLLLVSLRDLFVPDVHYEEKEVKEACSDGTDVSRRAVIFFLEGVSAQRMFNFTGTSKSYLSDIVSGVGSCGEAVSEEPVSTLTGLVSLISGVFIHEPVLPFWNARTISQVPSVLDLVESVDLYVSERIADYLSSLSKSYPLWNTHIAPNSTLNASDHNDWILQQFNHFPSSNHKKGKSIIFINLKGFGKMYDDDDLKKAHLNFHHDCSLQYVSKIVEKISSVIEKFYNDNKTVYILTSDRGYVKELLFEPWMSKTFSKPYYGSSINTHMPLIAWGTGINALQSLKLGDNQTIWPRRETIRQTDVAPLIASLLGVRVPRSSLGVLPIDYLNMSDNLLARQAHCNAQQVSRLLEISSNRLSNRSLLFYSSSNPIIGEQYIRLKKELNQSLSKNNYSSIKSLSRQLTLFSLKELNFNQKYYRDIVALFTCLSITLWIILLLLISTSSDVDSSTRQNAERDNGTEEAVESRRRYKIFAHCFKQIPNSKPTTIIMDCVFAAAFIVSAVYPIIEGWPCCYSFYSSLPIIILWLIIKCAKQVNNECQNSIPRILIYSVILILFAFTVHRPVLNYLGLMGFFLVMCLVDYKEIPGEDLNAWLLTSLLPLPLVLYESTNSGIVTIIASFLWLGVMAYYFSTERRAASVITIVGCIMLIVVTVRVALTNWKFISNCCFPIVMAMIGWCSFLPLIFIPALGSDRFLIRLLEISFLISSPYLLLNSKHESLSLLLLQAHMFTWVLIENRREYNFLRIHNLSIREHSKLPPSSDTESSKLLLRRSIIFVVYIFFAYLSGGNRDILTNIPFPGTLFPCIDRTVLLRIGFILKNFLMILTLCVYLVVISRVSKLSLVSHIVIILYFCNLLTVLYVLIFLYSDRETAASALTLSHLLIGLSLPLLVLVAFPLAHLLTMPSIFDIFWKWFAIRKESQQK